MIAVLVLVILKFCFLKISDERIKFIFFIIIWLYLLIEYTHRKLRI